LPIGAAACASALLFAVSLVDDRRHLPVWVRLPAHFASASVIAAVSPLPGGDLAAITMTSGVVLAIVWGTNLYNFMDGANGLAGGMAVIGFLAYAWIASIAGDGTMALVCSSIAGAALGFLPFNFGRARVFLGDCGSIPLGFLAGALGWLGFVGGTWKWWTPVLVFLPFVADATTTLVRRLARGERVWLAHRDHGYQKLVLAGWAHARLARWAYATMLTCAVLASVLQHASDQTQNFWLGSAVAIALLVLHVIERVCGRRRKDAPAGR
jgi:UDP-N-acetylmuramyl pentapeptide phosphotransferase/UDP-N-acetylglucosamine-1-phosphate transferase